ncbi:MAG: RNA ligase family protein [Bryobacteraceae bacterium]|nr:RNA ligase family protein [Bryobacteraceae bacterium]
MRAITKYPRTPHIAGSRLQPGDDDLSVVSFSRVEGRRVVVEEKLDGSNCGISFDPGGALTLQSRGHALAGGPRERQFDLLKRWANWRAEALWKLLGTRYVMYGEWLYARHTIYYDELPHYFVEFDLLDRESGTFLDTVERAAILDGSTVVSAPVLHEGPLRTLDGLIGRSRFASSEAMEGLYIKREEGGRVVERFKYIRQSFAQAVAVGGEHWMDRPIEPNRLRPGVDLFAR